MKTYKSMRKDAVHYLKSNSTGKEWDMQQLGALVGRAVLSAVTNHDYSTQGTKITVEECVELMKDMPEIISFSLNSSCGSVIDCVQQAVIILLQKDIILSLTRRALHDDSI
jgi:hypothetical protein